MNRKYTDKENNDQKKNMTIFSLSIIISRKHN